MTYAVGYTSGYGVVTAPTPVAATASLDMPAAAGLDVAGRSVAATNLHLPAVAGLGLTPAGQPAAAALDLTAAASLGLTGTPVATTGLGVPALAALTLAPSTAAGAGVRPYFDVDGASPGEVAGVGVAPDGRPYVDSSFPVLRGGVVSVELVDGRPVLTTEAGV